MPQTLYPRLTDMDIRFYINELLKVPAPPALPVVCCPPARPALWPRPRLYAPARASATLFMLPRALQALDFCHSKGIMHRDVKPHNVSAPAPGVHAVNPHAGRPASARAVKRGPGICHPPRRLSRTGASAWLSLACVNCPEHAAREGWMAQSRRGSSHSALS